MKNILRFLTGLLLIPFVIILIVLAAALLAPFVIAAWLIYILAVVLFFIMGFFAFVWFFMRKDPELGKKTNYSLKKGKTVK